MESDVQPRGIAVIAPRKDIPRGPGIPGSPDHLIRPGIGAGGVRIGMTEGQSLRVLGAPAAREECDGVVTITWPGIAVRTHAGPGGRVVSVRVTDRGIRTREGIGVGSTITEVRATVRRNECAPRQLARLADEALPGDRLTTFRMGANRTVTAVEVGRILG